MRQYQGAMLLKELADNQRDIEEYIQKQEKSFDALKDDIMHNRLEKGTPKEEVVKRYGDPVYCTDAPDGAEYRQDCLYRYPTEFFSLDNAHLYFDETQRLSDWKFESASHADSSDYSQR